MLKYWPEHSKLLVLPSPGVCCWNRETVQLLIKIACPACELLCFRGEAFEHLFITTSRKYLSDEEQEKYLLSGNI